MQLPYNLPQIPQNIVDNIIFTLFAFAIASIVAAIAKKVFTTFRKTIQSKHIIPVTLLGKTNTINSILFSMINAIVYSITILIVLSRWEVDIAPILTGAGILGIAITFGSQTLFKDIIAGFFILTENQYNVGDRIRVNKDQYEGRVSRMTLRITVIKDDKDNKIFIPNSQITAVTLLKDVTPEEGKLLMKKESTQTTKKLLARKR